MPNDISFSPHPDAGKVLTPDAVAFVVDLHRRFDARRRELLSARAERQARFDAGERPDFLPETEDIRNGEWTVPEAPKALTDRRVEITGPVERKMMINALNSGARVFMADFEDANSPTWDNVMSHAEDTLGLQQGDIRATVLIETITAAFEMDEILHELRDHICGLNAGRWDYIFSIAKRFHADPASVLPDRSLVTMTTTFMRAYTELLVKTCHLRGAHAIGGMSAFIPNRRKPDVTEAALAKVAEDKKREAGDGFDGTWVAHPDLVPTALAEFDAVLGDRANQLGRQRPEVQVGAGRLLTVERPPDGITSAGLHTNIDVGMRYITSWLSGTGAAAIHDLMEDAATAEISRAQVWQWVHHNVTLAEPDAGPDPTVVTAELVRTLLDETQHQLLEEGLFDSDTFAQARGVFEEVSLADDFPTFLTLPAYELLP